MIQNVSFGLNMMTEEYTSFDYVSKSSYSIPDEPENSPHFREFIAPRPLHRFASFIFSIKPERFKYFCDFSRCPTCPRSIGKFNCIKWLQNDGKGPKTLIKSSGISSNRTIGNGNFTSLKCYKTSIFKQMRKIFNPMAMNVCRVSLTHMMLHFLHYSVRGVIYALIDILGHFSVILKP